VFDTWHTGVPADVLETHMDPTEPVAVLGDHLLLREVDDRAAELLLSLVGEGSGSPLVAAELRQLGGALAVPAVGGGALSHLDARYAYMAAGLTDGEAGTEEAIEAHCRAIRTALTPWDTGRTTPTFVENHTQPQGHLSAQHLVTLDLVRKRVDPEGLFRGDITPNASAEFRP
jgi:hypothetical protein